MKTATYLLLNVFFSAFCDNNLLTAVPTRYFFYMSSGAMPFNPNEIPDSIYHIL
jgi:hypothetical protein